MRWLNHRIRRLDLQAKVLLILIAVILPIFFGVTLAVNQWTRPVLEQEIVQSALTAGKAIVKEISSRRLVPLDAHNRPIERLLQETLYSQPNLLRLDLIRAEFPLAAGQVIASTVEEDPSSALAFPVPADTLVIRPRPEADPEDAEGTVWEVQVPIHHRQHFVGVVSVHVSTRIVDNVLTVLGRTTAIGAAISVLLSILGLSYVLRRMIFADRKLKRAESENVELSQQLQEARRELMNQEKLAVMGQLTASFAHELGTPLNAIGGHLQLLREEISDTNHERLSVIEGQLSKIEHIVKDFLQSTARPASQKQLADVNRIVDQSLGIVGPRCDSLGIEVRKELDRSVPPVRLVPLEIEQVLLNLVNNSLDSLHAKRLKRSSSSRILEIQTRARRQAGRDGVLVSVYDTGEGIPKEDLPKVLRPFFTTKPQGEGTGLGLPICSQIVQKHGGGLTMHSKENTWTRVDVWIPYSS